jgi:hypothetical protein
MTQRLGDVANSPGPAGEAIAVDVSSTDQTFSPTTRFLVAQTAGLIKVDMEQTGTGVSIYAAVGIPLPVRVKKI